MQLRSYAKDGFHTTIQKCHTVVFRPTAFGFIVDLQVPRPLVRSPLIKYNQQLCEQPDFPLGIAAGPGAAFDLQKELVVFGLQEPVQVDLEAHPFVHDVKSAAVLDDLLDLIRLKVLPLEPQGAT